jgi:rubrerythrin
MGVRLLPRSLPELYAHALVMERDAAKRFEVLARCMRDAGMDHLAEEFETLGKEEREQYELLAVGTSGRDLPEITSWEYAWHYMGPEADQVPMPKNTRDVLRLALSAERRTMNFYADVAEHVEDDAVSAFAAEMATDEHRHVERLERLLAREPDPAAAAEELDQDGLPVR